MELEKRFEIPPGCEAYVVLQRTQFRSSLRHALRRLGLARFYDHRLAGYVEPLRRRTVRRLYAQELSAEFARLQPHLPSRCRNALDIGCGLAGIDAWIYHACGQPTLHLLDREGTTDLYYGFRADGASYNSLALARALLEMNGVDPGRITTVDVDTTPLPQDRRFDLVVSLLSWGFHYPVATYLDYVEARLAETGVVILDVRRGTDGYDQLAGRFDQVSLIDETPKLQRLKATGTQTTDQRSSRCSSRAG